MINIVNLLDWNVSITFALFLIGMLLCIALRILFTCTNNKKWWGMCAVFLFACVYFAFSIGTMNGMDRVSDNAHPYSYQIETGVKYHLYSVHKDGRTLVLNIVSINKNENGLRDFRAIRVKGPKPPRNFILGKSGVPIAIVN